MLFKFSISLTICTSLTTLASLAHTSGVFDIFNWEESLLRTSTHHSHVQIDVYTLRHLHTYVHKEKVKNGVKWCLRQQVSNFFSPLSHTWHEWRFGPKYLYIKGKTEVMWKVTLDITVIQGWSNIRSQVTEEPRTYQLAPCISIVVSRQVPSC